jgi:hypothetical protein
LSVIGPERSTDQQSSESTEPETMLHWQKTRKETKKDSEEATAEKTQENQYRFWGNDFRIVEE